MRIKRSQWMYNKAWQDGWKAAKHFDKKYSNEAIEEFGEPQTDLEIELYNIIND